MKNLFNIHSSTQLFSYLLFVISICILLISFILIINVDVLKDFKIIGPVKPVHAGEVVTFSTQFVKVRQVEGTAQRYIDCYNKSKIEIRYPVNQLTVNHIIGKGGNGIIVTIPETIPDLPTSCKFAVSVNYKVYPWRIVNEAAESNPFTLLPPLSLTP